VLAARQTLMTIRVDGMMEHALALIVRSSFEEADFVCALRGYVLTL